MSTVLAHIDLEADQIFSKETKGEMFCEKQFYICKYLLLNANQILTNEQIYMKVWKEPFFENDKVLAVHIR
ncbi:winged helix-turn-helix domain-containing protein [Salicibibacter cibi]|uniref:Winged helix-turn-helix domain-containing protein n=1 Tax=Salicibibacter cibi TaxID=2743001 RepID=A0A7T6ZC52_9BACI|nr:winged helix-turn-helix domain-containing protein [Salicibibacter cibi]QQK80691.1 winged helix-turn-helix domain-containing protein [Salicibibacter cibi]